MRILIFDIETGANEFAKDYVKPFDINNPDHVKYGNAKRPELREEIEKQAYAIYMSSAEKNYPLSGITGKVLCISYSAFDDENPSAVTKWVEYLEESVSERTLLSSLWTRIKDIDENGGVVVGFNNKKFDIPFVTQRSWITNTPVYPLKSGMWLRPFVIDLYEVWTFNQTTGRFGFVSNDLKTVCECLGIGTKNKEDGKHFEKIFYKDREKALEYAMNDIVLTTELYLRLAPFLSTLSKSEVPNESN